MFERVKRLIGYNQPIQNRNEESIISLPTNNLSYIYSFEDILNNVNTNDFLKIPEINKAIDLIAGQIGQITIGLWQNTDKDDVRQKNQLSRIIDIAPNKYMTKAELMTNLAIDYFIEGNAILVPKYHKTDGRYYLSELIYKPWRGHCYTRQDKYGGYVVNIDGVDFFPDEVIHLKRLRSHNTTWEGLGLREVLKDTVNNLVVSNNKMALFTKGSIFPKAIFSVDTDAVPSGGGANNEYSTAPIDITNPDNLLTTANNTSNKNENNFGQNVVDRYLEMSSDGYMLVPGKLIKVEQIKPTNIKDTALIESIKTMREVISFTFGLPSYILLGQKFDEKERNSWVNDVVRPFVNTYTQELTRVLLHSPDYYFKANVKSLMSFDFDKRAESVSLLIRDGVITNNEAREELNYGRIDDEGADKLKQLENYVDLDGSRRVRKFREAEKQEAEDEK